MPIKQTPTISVDIGQSNLKIIQTNSDGKIVKFAVHKMPEGCVDDLNITSEEALASSLKTARKKAKMIGGKCTLVISGSGIIIRHFTLPILEEEQLYQNILNEISGYLPVDPDKYYVDYKIVGIVQEDGIDMYKVLITTAHKRIINGYKKVLRMGGFNAKIIDTCENTRSKLLRYIYDRDNSFPIKGGICIVDFGTKHTRVNIYYDGYYYVGNILKRSSQSITEVISQNSGKDILFSETMKRDINFLNDEYENNDIKSAVTYEVDSLLFEIIRVFDYFRNRTKNTVHTIYITGGGSLLPGLKDYMEKHINIPVRNAYELIPPSTNNNNVDARGFAFLLNAYAATFREEQQ